MTTPRDPTDPFHPDPTADYAVIDKALKRAGGDRATAERFYWLGRFVADHYATSPFDTDAADVVAAYLDREFADVAPTRPPRR